MGCRGAFYGRQDRADAPFRAGTANRTVERGFSSRRPKGCLVHVGGDAAEWTGGCGVGGARIDSSGQAGRWSLAFAATTPSSSTCVVRRAGTSNGDPEPAKHQFPTACQSDSGDHARPVGANGCSESDAAGRFPDGRTALCQWFGDGRHPLSQRIRVRRRSWPPSDSTAVALYRTKQPRP